MLGSRLSSLRPLAVPVFGRIAPSNIRNFSSLRPNVLQALQKQRKVLSELKLHRYSADIASVQPNKTISWRRIVLIAGGVAGTAVILESALNRETRESLSQAERSLLKSSFIYTGAGIAITAAAARAMFASGVAYTTCEPTRGSSLASALPLVSAP
ncbi:hypothetical protein B0H19DRAFT_325694 [Mycena capillaripes]|nr:hypothetical protein B0H19DRAFT_325694 [Mycena capillaripes]